MCFSYVGFDPVHGTVPFLALIQALTKITQFHFCH
jgi:hypothetical protein